MNTAERIVECVPNFSEGRDEGVLRSITDAIQSVPGVQLLNIDPGQEMNRTVVTFTGSPEEVEEAAFKAIEKAAELIDMRLHQGSHPRMGATDVCPFVPVSGVSLEECIELSIRLARRVGDELRIPVYLYEHSARDLSRRNLANIREGEYEGLAEKLKDPGWLPDEGPSEFNAKAGATVIGAREFLIAYNINLNTREPKFATDIAFELRAKGRSARRGNTEPIYLWGTEILKYGRGRYPCGIDDFVGQTLEETIEHCREEHGYELRELLRLHGIEAEAPEGQSVKIPGKFPFCKAIGWFVPEYDRAQISINLTNFRVTSMHDVLEEARHLALKRGLVVTGSEIVGLVPYQALLEAGVFYLKRQGRSAGIPSSDILSTAIQSLGLRDVAEFNLEEKVLGLPKDREGDYVGMNLSEFVDEVSRESPAPGGGSVAALAGALGAALASMVANLTANKRGSESVDSILNEAAVRCQELKSGLLRAIDEDADAFAAVMEANRMPSNTEEERQARDDAIQKGLRSAAEIPLKTAELSVDALTIAETVAPLGNPNSISDIGVGARLAHSAVKGAIYNVLINLKELADQELVASWREQCRELDRQAQKKLDSVERLVQRALS
jgi:glutamate formiminotransferase/formiminotetrahydrofolate cyclodeaminase